MLYNLSVEQGVTGGRSALCEGEAIFLRCVCVCVGGGGGRKGGASARVGGRHH